MQGGGQQGGRVVGAAPAQRSGDAIGIGGNEAGHYPRVARVLKLKIFHQPTSSGNVYFRVAKARVSTNKLARIGPHRFGPEAVKMQLHQLRRQQLAVAHQPVQRAA